MGLTVTQPEPTTYDITAVPAATPLIKPATLPVAATAVLLLDHVPPPVSVLRVMLLPTHTDALPDMGDGPGVTVTLRVVKHPVLAV
jgi:hypothetical protein